MPFLPPRDMPLSPSGQGSARGTDQGQSQGERGDGSTASRAGTSSPARSRVAGALPPSTPTPLSGKGSQQRRSSKAIGPSQQAVASTSRLVSASFAADGASPQRGASVPGSPAASSATGTLERQDETTFHRKLRAMLIDHCSACAQWNDIVSVQGAKSIAAAARAAASLDEAVNRSGGLESSKSRGKQKDNDELSSKDDALPTLLVLSSEEREARRLDDIAKAMRTLDEERDNLDAVLSIRLTKMCTKLESLSDAAETLLLEATIARGDKFTFADEFWTTWPMEKFVSTLQFVTKQHVLQTAQLTSLVEVFFAKGCATGISKEQDASAQDQLVDITANGKADINAEEETDEEDGADEVDKDRKQASPQQKVASKRRALVRQRVLEIWQQLPPLHDEKSGIDAEWFDEICEAEVGRWESQ